MPLPKAKVLLDDEQDKSLAYTTTSGCDLILDLECRELLVFGAQGSEVVLTLSDLREIVTEFRKLPPGFLQALMSDD